MDGIEIPGFFTIPESELEWDYSTSGGPGGQHANRSATRVMLEWDYQRSGSVSIDAKQRLGDHSRTRGGRVRVTSDATRSQHRNRQDARERLQRILIESLRPVRRRKRTKPTRSSQQRRIDSKKRRSQTKKMRRRPDY
jgi:ribosome-associated protein